MDIFWEGGQSGEPQLLLLLTNIKNWVNYYVNHSVNVTIMSLYLGVALGFSRSLLRKLGIVALFHDIGYALIPLEVTEKPGSLDAAEWELVKRHPLSAVSLIARSQESDPDILKIIMAIFYHHKGFDLKGYPAFGPKKNDLFAEIITLVDFYDALMTSRPFRTIPMTSDQAINQLISLSGMYVNPLILKKFLQIMGDYPIGTPVLLSNGEVGVVMAQQEITSPTKAPVVQILMTVIGFHREGEMVDLSQAEKLSIVRSIDPINSDLEKQWFSSIIKANLATGGQ